MLTFKVRDFRNKGFFLLDDEYLNGYAKLLGTTASMVYIYLCRCADKNQTSFPSQEQIAEKLGINSQIVKRKIKELTEWGLIAKKQGKSTEGKWKHNTYFLLDKSGWKKPGVQILPSVQKVPKPGVQIIPLKDTHKKDTHTLTKVKEEFGNSSINKGMDLLTDFFGYKPSKTTLNRYALHRLIKSRGEERVFKAMEFALSQQSNRYCPVVTSYMDLEQKWADLEVYARREFSSPKKGGVVDASHL